MVATVRREFMVDADLIAALEDRSRKTGVPVDQILSEALRHEFDDRQPVRETRNGVRMVRRSNTGNTVKADDVIALWEDLT